MRIAHVNICDNGSTGKIILDIFSCLQESDEKVAFVSLKYTQNPQIKPIHSRNQYRVHKFLAMYLGLDEFGDYFETKRLIKELKKFKPDVLHLHNIHSYALNYRLLFKYIKKENVRVIWTLHDCWAFTGGCSHFDYNDCKKWRTDCKKCPHLKSAGILTGVNVTGKLYKIKKEAFTGVKDMTVICPSKWLAGLVEQSFLGEYPIKVINNGINLDVFKPTASGVFDGIIDSQKQAVLSVASVWSEKKGYNDLIKILGVLPNKYQLVVVGVDDNQKQELEEKGAVAIKRTNNQTELAELYTKAAVFINPTYEDTFPTTNIEALACGCPIVCYKTGGATEMLNKDNSVVVDRGDYLSMAEALDKAVDLSKNAEKNIKVVRDKYSKETMVENYKRLYL